MSPHDNYDLLCIMSSGRTHSLTKSLHAAFVLSLARLSLSFHILDELGSARLLPCFYILDELGVGFCAVQRRGRISTSVQKQPCDITSISFQHSRTWDVLYWCADSIGNDCPSRPIKRIHVQSEVVDEVSYHRHAVLMVSEFIVHGSLAILYIVLLLLLVLLFSLFFIVLFV